MAHLENGFLQLANGILLDLAGAGITAAQWAVVGVILHYTYGQVERAQDGTALRDTNSRPLKKKEAEIPLPVFCQHTRLSRRAIIYALDGLATRNIIKRVSHQGKPGRYGYQKYADKWLPCAKPVDKPVQGTALVQRTALVQPAALVQETAPDQCSTLHQCKSTQEQSRAAESPINTGINTQLVQPVALVQGTAPIINKEVLIISEQVQGGQNCKTTKTETKGPPPLDALMARYSKQQQKVINDYWEVIRKTRKRGVLAESIRRSYMDKWAGYPVPVVIQGLALHISKHQGKREEYTHGIIRRLKAEQGKTGGIMSEQNTTEFDIGKFEYPG